MKNLNYVEYIDLKKIRESYRLKQGIFAMRVQLSVAQLSKIERNHSKPSPQAKERILKEFKDLGVDAETLLKIKNFLTVRGKHD